MTSQTPNCTKVNTQNLSDRAHQITDITPKEKKENVEKVYISYTQLHKIVCRTSERIKKEFDPEVIVAIAGGGLVPARMFRTYLQIPIYTISVALYDAKNQFSGTIRTNQWLDERSKEYLKGKRVLIVDEVDDSRTTLAYCVRELWESVELKGIAVAVIHNKKKQKRAEFPAILGNNYFVGEEVEDHWCVYPWDAIDADFHEMMANKRK